MWRLLVVLACALLHSGCDAVVAEIGGPVTATYRGPIREENLNDLVVKEVEARTFLVLAFFDCDDVQCAEADIHGEVTTLGDYDVFGSLTIEGITVEGKDLKGEIVYDKWRFTLHGEFTDHRARLQGKIRVVKSPFVDLIPPGGVALGEVSLTFVEAPREASDSVDTGSETGSEDVP